MRLVRAIVIAVCVFSPTAAMHKGALHVMAFNVLFRGADDPKSLDAIAAEHAGVVCLTELTPRFAARFTERFQSEYPYRHFAPQVGTWGIGLASVYPLSSVRVGPVAPSGIPDLEATLMVRGRPVRLACVHLNPPLGKHRASDDLITTLRKNDDVREKQVATLVARFNGSREPVVLLGDFNDEPGRRSLAALSEAGFHRGCGALSARCGPSFPGLVVTRWPAVFTIDHVYARGLEFTMSKTLRAGGSDHLPVVAAFAPW